MAVSLFGITIGRTKSLQTSVMDPEPVPPGPFDRRRGDREVGATGTVYQGGFLFDEEYNSDLKGEAGRKVYERMASDGMVAAMLRSIVLPLRGAIPRFEPASEDEADVNIANACEQALLNMRGQLWDNFMRQAFTGTLQYGHSVFEQVYTDNEGKPNIVDIEGGRSVVAPYKLAPRLQKSIYQWIIDTVGDLKGVVQRVYVGSVPQDAEVNPGEQGLVSYSGVYKYITIPNDRLFVFTLEQDGANFEGKSILRSAYEGWYRKKGLRQIRDIAFERHGVGTPYAVLKQGIRKDEEDAIMAMLMRLRSHEKGAAVVNEAQLADSTKTGLPSLGYLDMPQLGTTARALNEAIGTENREMAVSILADFLTIGSGAQGLGNYGSTHRDKTSLFFNSIQGTKRPFEDSFQQQVVVPFVDINFGPQKKYPTFGLSSLESKDMAAVGRGLALMAQAGLITPSPQLENQLLEMMDLPELPTNDEGEPVYPEGTHQPPPAPIAGQLPPGAPGATPPAKPPTPAPDADNPEAAPLSERWGWRAYADPDPAAEALRKKLAQQIADNASQLADEEDDYDEDDFTQDSHGQILSAVLAALALGNGGTQSGSRGSISRDNRTWAQGAAEAQKAYLDGFSQDVTAGMSPDAIAARADLYGGTVWAGYQRGTVASMPKGSRIVWHAEGDATTCDLCAARDEQEYTEESLPGYPGEGGFGDLCEGAANCRCWLEQIDSAEMSEPMRMVRTIERDENGLMTRIVEEKVTA